MLSCKKTYQDIPFAHRQHLHDGHCSFIHGHNWSITLTFSCHEPDANGFVVDFGDLKYLKQWLQEHFDHACLINESDVEGQRLIAQHPKLFKAYLIPNASCEGVAQHLYTIFNPMVIAHTDSRAWITQVEVEEDRKNAAVYQPD